MPRKTRRGVRRLAAVLALAVLAAGWCGLRAALPDTFTLPRGKSCALPRCRLCRPGRPRRALRPPWARPKPMPAPTARCGCLGGAGSRRCARWSRRAAPSACRAPRSGSRCLRTARLSSLFGPVHRAGHRKPGQGSRPAAGRPDCLGRRAAGAQQRELAAAIAAAGGAAIEIVYTRDGETCTTTLAPVADRDTGTWRAGVWVRDSSAGIAP